MQTALTTALAVTVTSSRARRSGPLARLTTRGAECVSYSPLLPHDLPTVCGRAPGPGSPGALSPNRKGLERFKERVCVPDSRARKSPD